MLVMADRLAQVVDPALHSLVVYSILGGRCHGLDYISLANGNLSSRLRVVRAHKCARALRLCDSRRARREGINKISGSSYAALPHAAGETLVAVRTGVAVFADLFLCPLARQGLFYTLLLARLQIIRVALYLFNNVFGLDFTFKPAQRVFQRLAFL